MVNITIHRGELLQVKRIVTSNKKPNGSLYGLYTESDQPVVLIVCGGDKKKIDEYLWEKHKLLKLGEWFVHSGKDQNKVPNSSKGPLTLIFDKAGDIIRAYFKGKVDVKLDILADQSAFREYQSLEKYLQDQTKMDSSPIEEREKEFMPLNQQLAGTQTRSTRDHIIDVTGHNNDVARYTRTPQWYNTDRNTFQNMFSFVCKNFADEERVDISRNKSTEDMSFTFMHSKLFWVIEFPAEFPKGAAILSNNMGSKKTLSLNEQIVNVSNMKNVLRETFIDICKCQKCCNTEKESWV